MPNEHEIPVKVVDKRWWANPEAAASDSAAAPSLKPTYVEELERQVAEKDRIAQEYIAKYRQAASEFDEARLRLRREISKDVERTANSPFGVQMTKEVMWSQLEIGSLAAGIDLENRTQLLASTTGDMNEAMAAFLEKRTPTFTDT